MCRVALESGVLTFNFIACHGPSINQHDATIQMEPWSFQTSSYIPLLYLPLVIFQFLITSNWFASFLTVSSVFPSVSRFAMGSSSFKGCIFFSDLACPVQYNLLSRMTISKLGTLNSYCNWLFVLILYTPLSLMGANFLRKIFLSNF